MGLDISIGTDIDDQLYSGDYYDPKHEDRNRHHSLSRTFCNLMCRQHVVVGEPELDQLGRIAQVDITPLYDMETYGSEEELQVYLESAESEEERQDILRRTAESRQKLKGNIDKVLGTINALIERLSPIEELHLNHYGSYTLGDKNYFADFTINKGEGYIGNNFGQDLRNFKRFLEFTKERGATTVYFLYG